MKRLLLVAVLAACSAKSDGFQSNFAGVKLEAGKVSKLDGTPFTGKLVAKDQEIAAVARALLAGTAVQVSEDEVTGLVVVLPVKDGLVEGIGQVYVDLRAEKLNREVARRSDEAIALARARFGAIKVAEAPFVHGRLEGVATAWEPTGQAGAPMKLAEATFRDHAMQGVAVQYRPGTTTKLREITFDHGVKAGTYRTFHANGKLDVEATYVANQLDGERKAFYASGAPREKSTWKAGERIAIATWYPDGTKQQVDDQRWHSNGASASEPAEGVIETFHDSGNVASRRTYVAGVQHGPYATFYEDGAKWSTGTYVQGAEDGKHQRWWRNGKPALACTYASGQLDGSYVRWYANGTKWEEARYARGQRVGPYRKWWKTGKPAEVASYVDGALDGDFRSFYDTGAKWAAGTYVRGKPRGTLQRWFRDGKLGYVMHHDDQGRPTGKHEKWWPSGKPRLVASYANGRLDGAFQNWLEDGTVYEVATYQRGNKVQTSRPN